MQKMRTAVILVTFFLLPMPAAAGQQHAADRAILDEIVAEHVRQTTDDREAIQQALKNEHVRTIAAEMGVDLTRAESAVATLDDADVAALSAQARAVNGALAGGQSNVTISTTWIIIGLLVLILLIVAL